MKLSIFCATLLSVIHVYVSTGYLCVKYIAFLWDMFERHDSFGINYYFLSVNLGYSIPLNCDWFFKLDSPLYVLLKLDKLDSHKKFWVETLQETPLDEDKTVYKELNSVWMNSTRTQLWLRIYMWYCSRLSSQTSGKQFMDSPDVTALMESARKAPADSGEALLSSQISLRIARPSLFLQPSIKSH